MGRLKKDHSNYKTSGLWAKYKERPEYIKYTSKKNTNRWCRGKQGVEHDYQLVEKSSFSIFSCELYKCSRCSKKKHAHRPLAEQ